MCAWVCVWLRRSPWSFLHGWLCMYLGAFYSKGKRKAHRTTRYHINYRQNRRCIHSTAENERFDSLCTILTAILSWD